MFDFKLRRVDTESSSVIVVSSLVSLMVDQAGMKITVSHRPKSAYIARLVAHFAQRSVLWPDKRCACASDNQIITMCKQMLSHQNG